MKIKNVVVIGSGTMGSGIAAHLCNANIPVTLLDLKTEISENARERIHKSRPPLLIDKSKSLYPSCQIKISAQLHLSDFYESHGFKKEGKSYLEDGIPHIAMLLKK